MKTIRIAIVSIALLVGIQVVLYLDTPDAYGGRAYPCVDGTSTYISPAAAATTPYPDGCEDHGGYVYRPDGIVVSFYYIIPPHNIHGYDPCVAWLFRHLDEKFELDQTNYNAVEAFLSKNSTTYSGNLQRRFSIASDPTRGIPSMNDILMIWIKSGYNANVKHSYDESTKTLYSDYPLKLLGDPIYLGTDSYMYFVPRSIVPKAPDGITNTNCECCYKRAYWWFYTFAYSSTIFNVTMDGEEGVLLYARPPEASSTSSLK